MQLLVPTQKPQLRKLFLVLVPILAVALAIIVSVINSEPSSAARKEDWAAGNIISDGVFTDKNSMSVADIQSFLDSKIGTCDIWGTGKATEYGSNLTRAQYAASRGWAGPPYTCLNKYYEVPKTTPNGVLPPNNYANPSSIPSGAQSAAWIIKDAANRYNISPKVLLVKIATESSGPLTADKWPLFSQYRYAMGSHCPDSGPNGSANCDSNYAGFSIQLYSAAELMRWYLDSMGQPWWSYKKPYQNNAILWNVVERGCGSGNVYIQNKATAALYTYTPYQPNGAALNNMYGTGDNCSAYGNRNFWRVFWDWFGSSRLTVQGLIKDRYVQLGAENGVLGQATLNEVRLRGDGWWQAFQNGAIIGTGGTGFWESLNGPLRERWGALRYQDGAMGFPTSGVITGGNGAKWQSYQGGFLIQAPNVNQAWESKGAIRQYWENTGYEGGHLGFPTGPEVFGSNNSWWQAYQNGFIIGSGATGFKESIPGAIRNRWEGLGFQSGAMGFPTSNVVTGGNGAKWQSYQGGYIIQAPNAEQAWESKGAIREFWASKGYESSSYGYPTGPEQYVDGHWQQQYQGGLIKL